MSGKAHDNVPTILVADADAAQRRQICASLQRLGARLIEAADRDEAIARFQRHQPLLVTVGLQLPGCDSYQVCSEIRQLPGGQDAAIVMVTGGEDVEAIDRWYEIGGTDFVTKPINWQVLVHRVRYLLRAQQAFVALHQSSECLARTRHVATDQVSCSSDILCIAGASGDVTGLHGTLQDVTERKVVEERIRQLAYYDNLTGLPNRQNFMESAQRAIHRSARDGSAVSLLYIDLDMFKKINDTLGHGAGDELLCRIADRFSTRLSEFASEQQPDCQLELSRLGGDEFVLLAVGRHDPDVLTALARDLLESMTDPVWVEGRELYVTGSMGIACHPEDGRDVDTLLKHADTAMYNAKHAGRNRSMFYTSSMSEEMLEKLAIGSKLKQAIEQDEFSLHYQPQIRTTDGRVLGVEALLRWYTPSLGHVPPDTFIPVAEDTGLIDRIGKWVLEEACRQAADWRDRLGMDVKMAVNLSNRQFLESDVLQEMRGVLDRHGLPARQLELEITESTIMQDVSEARATLLALRDLGVQVSIDDFGTGYSSMSCLKSLPLDTLKIDRSFITDVSTNADSAAIARAIIAMARQLGIRTIAEGVETLAQFTFLQEHDCDEIQGYLVGRPMPPGDAEQFLRSFGRGGWKLDAASSVEEAVREPLPLV